jgi:hypothetical protein
VSVGTPPGLLSNLRCPGCGRCRSGGRGGSGGRATALASLHSTAGGLSDDAAGAMHGCLHARRRLPDAGADPVSSLRDAAADPVPSLPDAAADPVPSLPDAAADPVPSLPDAAADPVSSLRDAAADPVRALFDAGTDPVSSLRHTAADPMPSVSDANRKLCPTLHAGRPLPSDTRPGVPVSDRDLHPAVHRSSRCLRRVGGRFLRAAAKHRLRRQRRVRARLRPSGRARAGSSTFLRLALLLIGGGVRWRRRVTRVLHAGLRLPLDRAAELPASLGALLGDARRILRRVLSAPLAARREALPASAASLAGPASAKRPGMRKHTFHVCGSGSLDACEVRAIARLVLGRAKQEMF